MRRILGRLRPACIYYRHRPGHCPDAYRCTGHTTRRTRSVLRQLSAGRIEHFGPA